MKRENTSAGGRTGALSAVTETSAYGCFPAGTRILLADGSSKPIEQVTEGDRVASTDPDTGQPTTATVTATFTHHNVATLRLTTSTGQITTTAAHPFYVEGKGFTPAGQLTTEDTLRDHTGQPVHLHTIESTGTVQTVHNIEVNNTHTYHVATTGGWLLVHNGCRWDSTASRWRDTETGQFRTCPDTFTEVVDENGHVNFTDINQKDLPNEWRPSPNPDKFQDGGIKYRLGGESIHGHGENIDAPPDSYARNNPTATISRGAKYIDGTALGVDLGMTRAQPIFHSTTRLSTGNPTLEVPMEILDRINSTINRSTTLELEDEIAIMTDLMTLRVMQNS